MIIEACGFDSFLALTNLRDKIFQDIEKTVNADKFCLPKLKTYSTDEKFALKPGHKTLLINLSTKIESYLKLKASEKKEKLFNSSKSGDELKEELVQALTKYMTLEKCPTVFSTNDISEFEKRERNTYRCQVKCKFCAKKLIVVHKSYWMVQNIKKHLKSHVLKASGLSSAAANQQQNSEAAQTTQPTQSTVSQSRIISFSEY